MPTNAELQKQINDLQDQLTAKVTPALPPKTARWTQVVHKSLPKRHKRKAREVTKRTNLICDGKRILHGGEFDANKLGPESGYEEGVDYTLIKPKDKD